MASETKLSKPQVRALQWLADHGSWEAGWWGNRPFTPWPKELRPATYQVLRSLGLIASTAGERTRRRVSITESGRTALAKAGAQT